MKLLICSIFRDRGKAVDNWSLQLEKLASRLKSKQVFEDIYLAVYENDSKDHTKKKLDEAFDMFPKKLFKNKWLKKEDLKTEYFGSVIQEQRVINLANARNTCIDLAKEEHENITHLLFVEPDTHYDVDEAFVFLNQFKDKADVVSGVSFNNVTTNFYDSWAVRGKVFDAACPQDLAQTITSQNVIVKVAATFNCFCLYDFKKMKKHSIKFSAKNPFTGHFDCDTTCICLDLIKKGEDKIFINSSFKVLHIE